MLRSRLCDAYCNLLNAARSNLLEWLLFLLQLVAQRWEMQVQPNSLRATTNCPQQSNNQVNGRLAEHPSANQAMRGDFHEAPNAHQNWSLRRDLQLNRWAVDFGDQLNGKQWPLKMAEWLIFRRRSSTSLRVPPVLPLRWQVGSSLRRKPRSTKRFY